ncbi:MAG TPA: peroxide stress protein YaaA [Saprospiraceae bacterium]|nr:peroxide stress protein YaaA [Saprospiraceae bacterium]
MLILLSPAKTLQETPPLTLKPTQTRFKAETATIVHTLAQKSLPELKKLMKLSDSLAALTYGRYQNFEEKYSKKNAEPAGFAFNGAVYQGLDLASLSEEALIFAQAHLRILSGLYGVLRPLDLIQPYRLEMGTKLSFDRYKNLYDFWGDKITTLLNKDLKKTKSKTIINLASKEYFKSVDTKKHDGPVLTIDFREARDGQYKFITFNAKKARGLMARYIIQNQLQNPEDLKGFIDDDYSFNPNISSPNHWFFTR